MKLAEIIAKIIAAQKEGAEAFDGEKAFNALMAETLEGINNKNTELLGKLKDNKKIVDALPEGFTPEKWVEMTKSLEGVDLSKLSTPEQVEQVTNNLKQSHEVAEGKWTVREKTLMDQLQKTLVDSVVAGAISEAHGNTTLLAPHVAQQVHMVEEDGEFRAAVVDSKGVERFSMEKAGERMGIGELVNEFKTQDIYASAFDAGNGGGGASGSNGDKGQKNPFMKGSQDYSLTEQSKLHNSNPELAKQLQASATEAARQAA